MTERNPYNFISISKKLGTVSWWVLVISGNVRFCYTVYMCSINVLDRQWTFPGKMKLEHFVMLIAAYHGLVSPREISSNFAVLYVFIFNIGSNYILVELSKLWLQSCIWGVDASSSKPAQLLVAQIMTLINHSAIKMHPHHLLSWLGTPWIKEAKA